MMTVDELAFAVSLAVKSVTGSARSFDFMSNLKGIVWCLLQKSLLGSLSESLELRFLQKSDHII